MTTAKDLPPVVRAALDTLLASGEQEVSLDAVGDAIGAAAIDTQQIEQLLDALEAAGRKVVAPAGAGVATLRKVIPAAKLLAKELGRTPRVSEIATRTAVSEAEVRRALLLAKVMQR